MRTKGNWKELVISSARLPRGIDTTGEWTGQERHGERCQSNDAIVALASFIAGTIIEGCPCEICDHRRYIVFQLVYGVGIDDKVLNDTIFSATLPAKTRRRKNGTGTWSKKAPYWKRRQSPMPGKI